MSRHAIVCPKKAHFYESREPCPVCKAEAEIARLRGLLGEIAVEMSDGVPSDNRVFGWLERIRRIEAEQAEHSPNGEFGFIQHRNPEQAD